jgi:hypothetical protein
MGLIAKKDYLILFVRGLLMKYAILMVSVLMMTAGCHSNCTAKVRSGEYFGSLIKMNFVSADNLGKHKSKNGLPEKNGMVYTSRGGFIDIGHLREAADRTKYISELSFENMMKGQTQFSFRVLEPARYFVSIQYPQNWDNLQEKEKIAKDVSIEIGQYCAQTTTIWHEMVTWFGYKSSGFFSEYLSAFSWEDPYSDLLGVTLAARALKSNENNYDDAMTSLIPQQLHGLGAQPPAVGKQALNRIRGQWFKGAHYFFVTMNKRNFDIGLDDGFITPWLVPGICQDCEPLPKPVPNLDLLFEYGFSFKLEVEPHEYERGKILAIVSPDAQNGRFQPAVDYPVIMEYIKNEAIAKSGPEVDVPVREKLTAIGKP